MSTWRDIWRYGVIANRFYSENEEKGEKAFAKLMEVYDKPKKDGMIRYIMAEAYELQYQKTNQLEYKDKALKYYKKAKKLFPVKHWKEVAQTSYERICSNKTVEGFFNYKYEKYIDPKDNLEKINIEPDFNKFLWYAFQKVYSYTYLNDFARYVCLSALSRGSSEWPLSLVDFRTVLELEIKQCFPEIIDCFDDDNRYSLFKTIEKLEALGKIDSQKRKAFDNIRIAGNIAAHNLYADKKYKIENVNSFIDVLEFFNNYRKNNKHIKKADFAYPLCQLSIEQFLLIPDEESIKRQIEIDSKTVK
jgi:hypothetical protein